MSVKGKKEASDKIYTGFMELMESQFPVHDKNSLPIQRSPSYYADALHVHVNHLNKVLKKHRGKTTTQIISEKVFAESKLLLENTSYSIIEISIVLGFSEPSHFSYFFKKRAGLSPVPYRENKTKRDN
ncbi:MAG: AraC family transcriptional regulator [Muricauda sp.]|nr:helix-turn-helix domain-containing protein [Allomuricauda sp.]MBA4744497.1 AraC family transcriptional regulator [Allomuricauda sp.]